jgi:hypothetical protein
MTFDELLQEALEALGARLREQVAVELRSRTEQLRTEFDEERRRREEEARRGEEHARNELRMQLEHERARAAEELRIRVDQARAESREEARAQAAATLSQLTDARARAEETHAQLDAARSQLAEANARAEDVRRELADARGQLEDVRGQLAESRTALDASRDELVVLRSKEEEGRGQVDDLRAELEEVRVQLVSARAQIDEARGQADEARSQANDARADVDAARAATESVRVEAVQARARADAADRARLEAEVVANRGRAAEEGYRHITDAVRSFDAARTLGNVLDTLVESAQRDAARAAVLLLRGGSFRGWRFAGFGAGFEAPEAITVPLHEGRVLAEAVQRSMAALPGPDGQPGAPDFARLPEGQPCLAVPMMLGGHTIAVLYADAGDRFPGQTTEFNRSTLEVLARYAAQRLAVLTAFKAARFFAPNVPAATPVTGPPRRPDDEEESARRYARLLVSEIRLYHEADVAEGRERRDLSTRLGSEIARARVLYEQRVPPDVRRRTDYFHAELVRTLADGDARLLEAARP